MKLLSRLKYATNSRVMNTIALVADSGRTVDSSAIGVLKDALGARGKYLSDAERTYALVNLEKQYLSLAKSAPELAQEIAGLKNQILSYNGQKSDSLVKRFSDGLSNAVRVVGDRVSSVTSGISLRPAYTTAGLVAMAGAAILGCGDKSGMEIERLKGEKAAMQTSLSALRMDYNWATNTLAQTRARLEGANKQNKDYQTRLETTEARIGKLEAALKAGVKKETEAETTRKALDVRKDAVPPVDRLPKVDYAAKADDAERERKLQLARDAAVEAGRRNVKADYLVQAAEISRQDKLEAKALEISGRVVEPKIKFPVSAYEHQPGKLLASIVPGQPAYSGGILNSQNIGKSGATIEYLDNPPVHKVPEKKKDKPTRWERKAADKKYEKTRYNPREDLSVPVKPIIVKKKGMGRVFEEADKYRQNAVGELSRDHETSVKRSADDILAGGYHAYAALTFNQVTPKNHPELNDDDLRPEIAARGWWASVVDLGRRLAGPLNKKEQAKTYGLTEEGKMKDIPVLTYLGRNIFGLGNVTKNTINTATIGLGNNVLDNAEWAFDDFGKAGTAYGAAFVNVGREGLVGRLTPKARIGVNNVVDWVGLVPLNFAGHVVRGEGISHHENLAEAAGNEGYIGVGAESLANMFLMFGSGFVGGSGSSSSFTSSFGGGIGGSSGGAGSSFGGGIVGSAAGVR